MKKTTIITGITGQDGAYLAKLLLEKKYQVVGVAPTATIRDCWRLDYFGITKKIKIITGSLLDKKFVSGIVKKYQPQEFYNLAGQSSVARSWEEPVETAEINFLAVLHQLEAVRQYSPKTKFFQASSAEIYGQAPGVITEKTNYFQPMNPYGVSKLAAHQSVINYRERYGLFAVNGILFNHESPLRMSEFVTKIICCNVIKVVRGDIKTFSLGSLSKRRDFGFAGDFVDGMWRLLQLSKPHDAVFCTGQTNSIEDFVHEAFLSVGIKDWKKHVTIDPTLIRKREVAAMRGDHRLLTKLTRWKPTVNFAGLVKIMVDYERLQK